jgi:lipoprotein-releasing system permease protein
VASRWETLVGLRYLAATRNEAAPSIITVLSVMAVAIGVLALIVVLSVMGGFEGDLRNKILGARAHVLVSAEDADTIEGIAGLLALLDDAPGVVAAAPYVESELLITSPTQYSAVVLRGIDLQRSSRASDLPDQIIDGQLEWLDTPALALAASRVGLGGELEAELERLRAEAADLERQIDAMRARREAREASGAGAEGSAARGPAGPAAATSDAPPRSRVMPPLPPPGAAPDPGAARAGMEPLPAVAPDGGLPGILLGSELLDSLNVVVGETVDVIDPDGPIGPTGPTPLVRSFRVVGVFHSGLFEYDNRYAYVLIDVARDFVGVPDDAATGVELRAQGPEYAGVVASAVRERLGASGLEGLDVADWMELNSTLFAALELEKYVMGGIMMVIVLVASFAIICVLIMVVIQRGAEIAVLRSMGASQGGILLVFLTQGAAIGVIGTVVGGVLGLGIALALQIVGFPLDPEVYYIDRLPIEVEAREVVSILVGAVVISVLATLYPSVQASRLDPAGGLRYE